VRCCDEVSPGRLLTVAASKWLTFHALYMASAARADRGGDATGRDFDGTGPSRDRCHSPVLAAITFLEAR
jgi:hypothetical protein